MASNTRFILGSLLISGLFAVLFFTVLAGHYFHYEDAFITYTFARNIAHGHGFVFHPDLPPVQGASSLLHTLLLAGLAWLLPFPVHQIGAVFSMAFFIALSFAMVHFVSLDPVPLPTPRKLFLFAVALCFQLPLCLSWGLETTFLHTVLFSALLCVFKKRKIAAAFCLALIPLIRFDYLFFLPFFGIAMILVFQSLRTAVLLALPALGSALLYLLGAQWYFGLAVPHTWIAKSDIPPEVSGVLNWLHFFSRFPWIALLAGLCLLLLLLFAVRRPWSSPANPFRRNPLASLLLFCLAGFLYTVILQYKGAPDQTWYYLTPLVFLFAAALAAVRQTFEKQNLPWLFSSLALVILNLLACRHLIRNEFLGNNLHLDRREHIGVYLKTFVPDIERKTVLGFEMGKIPYYSGAKCYDLLGLVTPEAIEGLKAKDTSITFRKLDPDFLAAANGPDFFPIRFIRDPSFQRRYAPVFQSRGYILFRKIESP